MTSNHRKWLKDVMGARKSLVVPGVMNALAARIADDMGFEALYITGAGVTNAYLGLPDMAFLSLSQLADHVSVIRAITDKPLIVDGDTGFGNAVNVWHTVRTLEMAGASAVQFEDQEFPKRCGHFDDKAIISTAEMVNKIRSAIDARTDTSLQIVARTDAYAVAGKQAAIDRANAFVEAGADIIFVEAPPSLSEIEEIIANVPAPHVVNMVIGGKTAAASRESLEDAGASIILYANASLQGAILGMQNALLHLKQKGTVTEMDGVVATFAERQRLVGIEGIREWDAKYSGQIVPQLLSAL